MKKLSACSGTAVGVVASADSLEKLARPLLEMLGLISGLESLYLTSIDEEARPQSVEVTCGPYALDGESIEYANVSAGVIAVRQMSVDRALGLADAAMYSEKRRRKQSRFGGN